jgi:hypothetical protein
MRHCYLVDRALVCSRLGQERPASTDLRYDAQRLFRRRDERLREFTDPWHGLLEIYAIHWE